MPCPTGSTRCRGRAELPAALARLAAARPIPLPCHADKK